MMSFVLRRSWCLLLFRRQNINGCLATGLIDWILAFASKTDEVDYLLDSRFRGNDGEV
jgi:hypothetical protein